MKKKLIYSGIIFLSFKSFGDVGTVSNNTLSLYNLHNGKIVVMEGNTIITKEPLNVIKEWPLNTTNQKNGNWVLRYDEDSLSLLFMDKTRQNFCMTDNGSYQQVTIDNCGFIANRDDQKIEPVITNHGSIQLKFVKSGLCLGVSSIYQDRVTSYSCDENSHFMQWAFVPSLEYVNSYIHN